RSAGNRRNEVLRVAPSELFDDLEPDRLRALGVVRTQVDVDESPAVAIGHLGAQPVHVVVGAGDRENRRIEDRGAEDLPRFEAVGNEHAALDPETGGVCRNAVRKVAGRRTREHVEPEFRRPRRGYRDDAILVRQRGMVHRVVLDVELADAEPPGEPIASDERRESGIESGSWLAGDRQQLTVTPQVLRAPLDRVAGQRDRVVVVHRLERAEALVADVGRGGGKRRLAEMTLESGQHATSTGREFEVWSSRSAGCRMRFDVSTGAGTIAARSRAIAAMSLRMATAVASPPAPAPKIPISPECSPVISAAFCGPDVRPNSDRRPTSTGATQAVSTCDLRS